MEVNRRELLEQAGKFLVLSGAARVAFQTMTGETPPDAEKYKAADHWWGMTVDITKCIGCGNCVKACAEENDVPEGYFRTWVERYHVSDPLQEHPQVDSPNGGMNGFPLLNYAAEGKSFFVPKLCNHCADSPCAGLSGGRNVRVAGRRGAGGSEILPGMPLLRSGVSLWLPLYRPPETYRRQVHLVLSPHHAGLDYRVLRSVSDGRAQAGRFQGSQGSGARVYSR